MKGMERNSAAKIEILAPAGSVEALRAAVNAKADAVYLGLRDFSARQKSTDFTLDNLREHTKYCADRGVDVYLAANTLVKDSELDRRVDMCIAAKEAGVSAFIVQDLGLAKALRQADSGIRLFASTQLGVHNVFGAAAAEAMGFERVILSRETTLEDIYAIKKCTNVQLEFFVHGALCVAFSGNCYFSSAVSGFSGNRGRCMQLCRKNYEYNGIVKKRGALISEIYVFMIDNLDELVSAGITSLKIEGRLRSPAYVSECVRAYKNALCGKRDISGVKRQYSVRGFTNAHIFSATADTVAKGGIKKGVFSPKAFELEVLKTADYKAFECADMKNIVQIRSLDLLDLVEPFADAVAFSPAVFCADAVLEAARRIKKPFLLSLPMIARGADLRVLHEIRRLGVVENIIANNIYALSMFCKSKVLFGTGLNLLNNSSGLSPKIVSLESYKQTSESDFVTVFSRYPLMTFCHCPSMAAGVKCGECDKKTAFLTDERGNSFELMRTKIASCYHSLLNCVPLYLGNHTAQIKKRFYDFSCADRATVSAVIEGKDIGAFTRGAFLKGIK